MKKIIGFIGVLAIGCLAWYMFLKPCDYRAKINVNSNIGTINQTIKIWNNTLENSEIIEQIDLNDITQKITLNDSVFKYNWKLTKKTDSISQINICVKHLSPTSKSIAFKLFRNKNFKNRTKKLILDFHDILESHLKAIKIKVEGESSISSAYCAYVEVKCKQSDKAKGMMKLYPVLNSLFATNKVQQNGDPFLEITFWDIQKDSINYNFCYPIIRSDSLPKHNLIKYKKTNSTNAIKAIYNGNYITSDRAWYSLLDYAERKNISIIKKPIEIFYNNPNMGGDEMNWKTEVFLPIIEQPDF